MGRLLEGYDKEFKNFNVIPLSNVKWESGELVSAQRLKAWLKDDVVSLTFGSQGGQHSGYQDCVMRYDIAAGFIRPPGSPIRYLNHKYGKNYELTGMDLCDQRIDSAVPSLNLPSLNRYDDAPNGFCRSQICINDPKHRHVPGGTKR